jgi:hypothetical protein
VLHDILRNAGKQGQKNPLKVENRRATKTHFSPAKMSLPSIAITRGYQADFP